MLSAVKVHLVSWKFQRSAAHPWMATPEQLQECFVEECKQTTHGFLMSLFIYNGEYTDITRFIAAIWGAHPFGTYLLAKYRQV